MLAMGEREGRWRVTASQAWEASFWVEKVFWSQTVVVTAPHCMC